MLNFNLSQIKIFHLQQVFRILFITTESEVMNKGILILFRKWSLFERNLRISDTLNIYKSTISLLAHKVAQRLSSSYLMNSLKEKVLLLLAMTCIFQSNIICDSEILDV